MNTIVIGHTEICSFRVIAMKSLSARNMIGALGKEVARAIDQSNRGGDQSCLAVGAKTLHCRLRSSSISPLAS